MADLDEKSSGKVESRCLVSVGSEEDGKRKPGGGKYRLLPEVSLWKEKQGAAAE